MKCKKSGFWQGFVDGEVRGSDRVTAENHLRSCARCAHIVDDAKRTSEMADQALSRLDLVDSAKAQAAWDRFRLTASRSPAAAGAMHPRSLWAKPSIAALGITLALVIALSIPAVRSVAEDFLQIFRVERFEAVRFDPRNVNPGESASPEDLAGILAIEARPETKQYASFEEARRDQSIDFTEPAHLPAGLALEQVLVTSEGKMTLTFDRQKIKALAQKIGVAAPHIPDELDGVKVTGTLPPMVAAIYSTTDDANQPTLFIHQGGKPSMKVPARVDAQQVRETLLDLPLLPPEFKKVFASVENWQETLPIPIPEGEAQSENIVINGRDGLLITGAGNWHTILWVSGEKMFVVAAGPETTLGRDQVIRVAKSL